MSVQAKAAPKSITGIVVSAGRMQKTVKVRVTSTTYNKKVQKLFATHEDYLVHDPSSAARTGDVVSIQRGYRASTHVRHLLSAIVSPVGKNEGRPSIPTLLELQRLKKEKKLQRDERLLSIGDAVQRARAMRDRKTNEDESEGQGESRSPVETRASQETKSKGTDIKRGLNSALKRIKLAKKAAWRKTHSELSVDTADGLKAELLEEARVWGERSAGWLTEAYSPAGRGQSKKYREETVWRGNICEEIAHDLRRRATEVEAYIAQVEAFESTDAPSKADAAKAMHDAQDDLLGQLFTKLEGSRGVYRKELESLRHENDWIPGAEWLHEAEWRLQAHHIRLREDGRMSVMEMMQFLRDEAGRNSPVWYSALRQGLGTADLESMDEAAVQKLRKGVEARATLLADFESVERTKKDNFVK